MIARPFIVKTGEGRMIQAPRIRFQWREVMKTKRIIAGLGREVEHYRWDKTQVKVTPSSNDGQRGEVVSGWGHSTTHYGTTVEATAAGLKTTVRRLAPKDVEALAQIDAEIEAIEATLQEKRSERKQALARAWARGTNVWANEALPTDRPWRYLP